MLPRMGTTKAPITAGELLRRLIAAEHGTLEGAAGELGTSRPHLSNIILGRFRPGRDLAVRIESVYGVPVRKWGQG